MDSGDLNVGPLACTESGFKNWILSAPQIVLLKPGLHEEGKKKGKAEG